MAASEGVDLEWAIVELSRVRLGLQKKPKKLYSTRIKEQASKCVNHIFDTLGDTFQIWHSDEHVPGIGSIYANPEPKTDIVVYKDTQQYFMSVKMEGPIQLASGQGKSTAQLFMAAADNLSSEKDKRVLKSIIKELETMPTRLLAQSNYDRITQSGNPKLINEFVARGKIIKDKSYDEWLKNNKPQLLGSLMSFVSSNPAYYDALIFEALTGTKTLKQFKGAVANSIISPSGFFIIDGKYVQKIRSKVKMDLRAKSRGGISSIAFRIETRGSV